MHRSWASRRISSYWELDINHSYENKGESKSQGDSPKALVFAQNWQTGASSTSNRCCLPSASTIAAEINPQPWKCEVWQAQWEECPSLWLMRMGLCPNARPMGLAQPHGGLLQDGTIGSGYPVATPCNSEEAIRDAQKREDPKSRGYRGAQQEEESTQGQEKPTEGGSILLQRTCMGVRCPGSRCPV